MRQRISFREDFELRQQGQIVDQLNRSITLTSDGTEDLIISQGFGGTYTWKVRSKTIRVQKSYWPCEESLGCPWQVQQQELFGMTFWVVDRITLPSQAGSLTYTFSYNAPFYTPGDPYVNSVGWGELSGITLPTGAHADYSYAQNGSQPYSATPDILRNSPTSKVLTYNQEYDGSSTAVTETWNYAIDRTGSTITGPDGGTIVQSFIDTQATFWNSGQIYSTVNADGSKTETIWAWNELANGFHANSYPKTIFTSIKNAAGAYVKTAIRDYKYDKNGNVTRVAEYDWIDYATVPRDAQGMPTAIPNVSPTRVTLNTYFNATPDATQLPGSNSNVYWSSGSPAVKNAIATAEVRKILTGGAESAVTRAEYSYDNPSVPANVTQVRTWDSTKGSYTNPLTTGNSLTATTQYNQYGMPTLVTDARGLKTQTTYGQIASVSDLYPTQIKVAYQTAQERTETRQYDFATGLVTRITDADNNVSTFHSFDVFGRPTLVRAAEGKPEETETTYEYSEALRRVITRAEFDDSNMLVSIEHFDQLGRVRLRRQLETAAQSATNEQHGIKVQTRYAFSGANSYLLVSNPYRAATSIGAGSEQRMGWTRNKNDNAGRTIEVQTFGGAGLPAPWASNATSTGTVTTAYDANFTTVTDQAQKQRRSATDGLGRLIRVDEPDLNSNLGATTSPNQPTSYQYDVLDNLTKVTQSDGVTTQNRDFVYSSLSRLTSAANPESGTTNYQYDEIGNVVVKTDARGVSVHYAYDALNRVTRRWYNGSNLVTATTHNSPALPSGVDATAEVNFYYDAQSLPTGAPSYSRGASMGRLVAQTYGTGSNGDYFAYDPLGRAKLKIQQVGTINYQMSAAYNLGSAITSLTYPSGHTITNSYDEAGRLQTFSGNLGDGATRTYSSGIIYSTNGALAKEQFGTTTPVYNKLFYNSRGQLAEIRAGTSYTGPTDYSADRGAIVNNYSNQCTGICYGSSMTDNNGNLRKQEIHIPNQQLRWQQYEYDPLNRLLWAREVLDGGAEQWKQKFNYDRWGNRTIDTAITYGTGINNKAFTVIAAKNRLGVPSGQSGLMSYDAAGNLTNDTYTGAGNRTYDAENKITSAWGGNNQAQLYSYDGSGQRIKRTVDGVQTWQVYGFGGELIAEYAANSAVTSPHKEYGYRNGQLLIVAEAGTGAVVNHSLSLNGTSNYAQAPSSASLNITGALTVEAWIKINSIGAFQDIVTRESYSQSGTGGGYELCVTNLGKVRLDLFQSPTQYTTLVGNTTLTTGVWHHVAGVFDGSQMRVYLNGVLDGTLSTSNAPASGTSSLKLGRASWGSYFGGLIDEARVSNAAIYTSNFTPAASLTASGSTKGLWKFDGQNLSDSSGNGNHGTLISGAYSTNVPAAAAQNVGWTNAVGVTVNGNSLSKPGATGWNAGAASTQALASGDGYVQFTASETSSDRIIGLSNGDSNQNYTDVDFGFYLGPSGYLCIYEAGVPRGCHGFYAPGDTLRVAVESSVVKYRKNGNVVYTSAATPNYPLLVDTALYTSGSTISNVVISGNLSSGAGVQWLVTDHLGTPRMVFDETGSLANVKRHDYLPFGEELFAPTGGRSAVQGYAGGDGVRQQFTSKERDNETGLDYFLARYYSSTQGRFTSFDPEGAGARESDPQSWNGYAYAGGNPVLFSDPDGREYLVCDPNGKNCTRVSDEAFAAEREKLKKDGNVYTGSGDFYESGEIKNAEGGVVATYVQFSIDDLQHRQLAAIAAAVDPIPMATLQFFGLSAVLGAGGGAIAYVAPAAVPFIAPAAEKLSVTGPSVGITLMSQARNPTLRNIIDSLYRVGAKIGSGSTADAIRFERATGQLRV